MLRKEAISRLQNCSIIDSEYCKVENIKVKIEDKDLLLNQLLNDEVRLKVPLCLYLGSSLFMELKIESNKLYHSINK